jgi:hypothetical protein
VSWVTANRMVEISNHGFCYWKLFLTNFPPVHNLIAIAVRMTLFCQLNSASIVKGEYNSKLQMIQSCPEKNAQ